MFATLLDSLWHSTLNIAVGVVVAIPLLLYPLLYLGQEKMLFHPREEDEGTAERLKKLLPTLETVTQTTPDGLQLHGFRVPTTAPDGVGKGWLIYFGGNAELVSDWLTDAPPLPEWSLLAMDYRGFGRSTGQPGEEALLQDALLLHDRLLPSPPTGSRPPRVVVMGRSLGSGVAVHLAAHRPVAGAILVTPFDSLVQVAKGHFPYVPVSWLLKHRFDSVALAPQLTMPALFLIAGTDTTIPPRHAEQLANRWQGPMRLISFRRADHNDIAVETGYWRAIREFLAGLP